MAGHSSRNVLLPRTTRFSTIFKRLARLALFGITLICVSHKSSKCQFRVRAHVLTATQYCDGLRGAFVLYDPYDPHKSLYDIDNGMML
jgi:hypothetical protein